MKLCEVAEILFSFPEKSIAEMHNTANWLTSVCLKAENEISGSKSANWLPESAPTTHEGDIIIKRIQPLYVNYIDNNYVGYKVGQNLAIIRAKSEIEPKYLAYVLEKNIDKIYEDITGTTIPAIRKEGFAKLEIGALPAREVQCRIGEVWWLLKEKRKKQQSLMRQEANYIKKILAQKANEWRR